MPQTPRCSRISADAGEPISVTDEPNTAANLVKVM